MTKRNITTQVTVRGDIGDVYVRDCYDLGTDEPTTRDMLLCEMLMEFHERLATSERRLTALEAQKGSQPDPNPIEIDNEWMDAPMGEPKYSKATCRGSYVFGTACGHCERCADERKTWPSPPPPTPAQKVSALKCRYCGADVYELTTICPCQHEAPNPTPAPVVERFRTYRYDSPSLGDCKRYSYGMIEATPRNGGRQWSVKGMSELPLLLSAYEYQSIVTLILSIGWVERIDK